MTYTVLIKYLATELIAEGPFFTTRKKAAKWAEEQMSIWQEDRAFKVVKVRVAC